MRGNVADYENQPVAAKKDSRRRDPLPGGVFAGVIYSAIFVAAFAIALAALICWWPL